MERDYWHDNKALMRLENLPFGGELLPSIFNSFPHSVEIFDKNGECIYSNCRFRSAGKKKQSGEPYNLKSDVRITRSEIYPVIKRAYEGATTIFRSKQSYLTLFPFYRPDTLYDITIFPIIDDIRSISMVALIHCAVVENGGAQADRQAQDDSERKDFITAFLSNISHEFRTPLSWVMGYSELISQEDDPAKIREHNKLISKGGNLLLSLVDNLIETSTAYKESLRSTVSTFSINKLLIEISGLIGNEISMMGRPIEVRLNNQIMLSNAMIETDRSKLQQILLNLLHNAVKFTSEGYIEIGVQSLDEDKLQFYVSDTGIGIEKSRQDFIFNIYSSRPTYENMNEYGHGLGLGLMVSRDFVEKLGGRIWVDSEPGNGSTFTFTIMARVICDQVEE
ncbi:MAG: sensor histidine kinase [Bacteroidota bacterium]